MALNIQPSPYNPRLKVIPATELKNKTGAVLDWTDKTNTDLVVESRGKPKAVIISYEGYERVQQLREEEARRQKLNEWEKLSEKIRARNPDMTEAKTHSIAQEFRDEALNAVVETRKKKYG